jgi:tRNA (guanine37-N1)-methyltransferase
LITVFCFVMHFHIITLFPESLASYIGASIIGRAIAEKKVTVHFYNPRDFTDDPNKRIDRRQYGGGPGMVLAAEPLLRAAKKAIGRKKHVKVILFSAAGKQFTAGNAQKLARGFKHIVLIAGRYEGIDARVGKILHAELVSIGPYILTGGELPGLVVVDAIARHIPGVLGKSESLEESRIASSEVYTRPEVLLHQGKKYRVPKVLLSGNHAKIEAWRKSRIRSHAIG